MYITHNDDFYASGGGCYEGTDMEYPGKVSKLSIFDNGEWEETVVVENLGVSNHDHGLNQFVIDNDGDLLVSIGGTITLSLSLLFSCFSSLIIYNLFSYNLSLLSYNLFS